MDSEYNCFTGADMASIDSRHGFGDESAPWANEVTDKLTGASQDVSRIGDKIGRALKTGATSFVQAGNRRQELENAWTLHPLTVAFTASTPQDELFAEAPVQGPEWANWAAVVSVRGESSGTMSQGSRVNLTSKGSVLTRDVWGDFYVPAAPDNGLEARSIPNGALIPVQNGFLPVGWWWEIPGGGSATGSTAVVIEYVVNWIR